MGEKKVERNPCPITSQSEGRKREAWLLCSGNTCIEKEKKAKQDISLKKKSRLFIVAREKGGDDSKEQLQGGGKKAGGFLLEDTKKERKSSSTRSCVGKRSYWDGSHTVGRG